MNPNGVEIVRVYTRETGGAIADVTPHVSSTTGGSFDVVVEVEAGSVKSVDGSPYRIIIEAFDLTTGEKPLKEVVPPNLGAFSKQSLPGTSFFNWVGGAHTEIFPINLNAAEAAALQGHILRYVASLVTPPPGGALIPQIVSFVESPLFMVVSAG